MIYCNFSAACQKLYMLSFDTILFVCLTLLSRQIDEFLIRLIVADMLLSASDSPASQVSVRTLASSMIQSAILSILAAVSDGSISHLPSADSFSNSLAVADRLEKSLQTVSSATSWRPYRVRVLAREAARSFCHHFFPLEN